MKKRRLKKSAKIVLIAVPTLILFITVITMYLIRINTLSYKLHEVGYEKEEIEILQEKLDVETQKSLLDRPYNQSIPLLVKEPYFLQRNLENYLTYLKDHAKMKKEEVIGIVNVHADKDFYTDTIQTDTSLGDAVLVNKYYYLTKDYDSGNIEDISAQYAYDGNSIRDYVYDAFIELWEAAQKEGYTFIINSSYRPYEDQEEVYESYKDSYGTDYADSYAARPGFSEHQTGLALDIISYPVDYEDFEDTEAYQWLLKHAHEYGFILRYPEGKEKLTGYHFESWHYRYLGKELATKVYKSGLTYDEYYAFYYDKKAENEETSH